MKISASDIRMASNSSYLSYEKRESQTLNQDGGVISTVGVSRIEREKTFARARYTTSGADTARIAEEGGQKTEAASRAEAGVDRENTGYLASVYEWAADAIDQVVAAFAEQSAVKNGKGLPESSGSGGQRQGADNGAGSLDFQISVYKKVSDAFRSQARALTTEKMRFYAERVEMENTAVQAGGTVRTADGRQIGFTLDVQMNRQSVMAEKVEMVRVIDPLIIDLTGEGISLSGEKRNFDLDGDGMTEQVAMPGRGGAFLALDLNQDGKINSGLELFGPTSGDGFGELSLYDKDRNMWIDENDEIFDELKVWVQDGSEEGVLKKLSEAGIGAIHLGRVASEFSMEDALGQDAGQVRSTGVALTESGEARAVQQIDLIA